MFEMVQAEIVSNHTGCPAWMRMFDKAMALSGNTITPVVKDDPWMAEL